MNKMCYIEVCTEKTDVPDLINRFTGSQRNVISKESVPETIYKKTDIKDNFISKQSGFKYETVVHQAIKELREE